MKHAITVNSATSGLHAAVAASLAGLGDEVIVPPYTMSATATTVAQTMATPIFADIDPDNFCLDVADVRRKINQAHEGDCRREYFRRPGAPSAELRVC